jgi:transcriptional regulator with XRE-family HTH domain
MARDVVSELIADNLARLLKERGISALELGQRCSMGRSSVYDILNGRSSSPKVATVAKLASGLNVPLTELFMTPQQLEAQSQLQRVYQELPPQEQRRLMQVAQAWRLG